jgi:Fic family protein
MKRGLQGRYVAQTTASEPFQAFLPSPLPPIPPIEFTPELAEDLAAANLSLGRLDSLGRLLPDVTLLLYFYVRKEAVLSSQIEGTQSSLSDLLLFESHEMPGVPLDDVEEVSSYVAAMEHGLKRLEGGFPFSLRLLREIHGVLLATGRGSDKDPGEFRRSQNWIGGSRPGNARYVPPPAAEVVNAMGALEKYLHAEVQPGLVLLKVAMAHLQFETIHPFLDGNGRLGRLLITLYLCWQKVLSQPLLYLSLYLKSHRDEYFDLLQRVRQEGVWEDWLRFFLAGVGSTADEAVQTANSILEKFRKDREQIANAPASVLRLHELLQRRPLVTVPAAATELKLTQASVGSAMNKLLELGIVSEFGSRKRNRLYAYREYLKLLSTGTETTPSARAL